MTTPGAAGADHPATALARMSAAFAGRDVEALLDCFSDGDSATYAGSESGEIATGAGELRDLFARLFARHACYSFAFPQPRCEPVGDAFWLLAEGTGYETHPDGAVEEFRYRVTGLLRHERGTWRWVLLAGSEPSGAVDVQFQR